MRQSNFNWFQIHRNSETSPRNRRDTGQVPCEAYIYLSDEHLNGEDNKMHLSLNLMIQVHTHNLFMMISS